MKFNDLLDEYCYCLTSYDFKEERTKESMQNQRVAIHRFFQSLKYKCDDYYEITKPRTPNDEEKEKFKYIVRDDENKIDIVYDLIYIIDYRGVKLPIYNDDYGQCMFTVIDRKEYSMGTYNFCLDNVCDIYDDYAFEQKKLYNPILNALEEARRNETH